ncbi:MAG: hypothetical protein KF893_06120 [Caldilineaceae bacterium]|nr:hypothetical protein [Caldilineaceae bacterium]
MNNGFSNLVSLLITQLPMLIVYAVGLMTAHSYRQQFPQASNRLTWAILILVTDAIILSLASQWILNRVVMQGERELYTVAAGLGLVRSLVHAWAFILILNAIFPSLKGIQLPRRLLGGVLGLLIGGALGLPLGDAIAASIGVTSFEGARGYFVVLLMVPLFAIVGAVLGFLIAGAPRPVQ